MDQASILRRLIFSALVVFSVACNQSAPQGKIIAGAGPGGRSLNLDQAVLVHAPLEFKCEFRVSQKKAIVIYHFVSNRWKPQMSCNNAGGSEVLGRVLDDEPNHQRMITGWYEEKIQRWKQCDLRGWKTEGESRYLSCQTPDGGSFRFICLDRCRS
jgi:hypothetical protein